VAGACGVDVRAARANAKLALVLALDDRHTPPPDTSLTQLHIHLALLSPGQRPGDTGLTGPKSLPLFYRALLFRKTPDRCLRAIENAEV
jgi:hypothetical protein